MQIVEKPWKDEKPVYTFNYTLPGSGEILKYKPLTMKEIKQVLLYENGTPDEIDEVLDTMIESCILSPSDFSIDNLYLQDRFSLMIDMKVKSEGGTYEFDITCPKCGSQSHQVLDLNTLPSKARDKGISTEVVINDDMSIFVDSITRGEQKKVEAIQNQKEYKTLKDKLNEKIFLGLVASVKKIKFKGQLYTLEFEDALEIVDGLTKEKFKEISEMYNKLDFGTEFIREIVCPHFMKEGKTQVLCGYKEEFRIPVESFFL